MTVKRPISAIDLFCGAGGLTHGFALEDVSVKVGIDTDSACQYPYESNNDSAFLLKDVAELEASELLQYFPEGHIKLLAGCAPCQPFSTYSHGHRKKRREDIAEQSDETNSESLQDEKWGLLYSFLRLAEEIRPELITMENVVPLRRHSVFHDFVSKLKELGYSITHFIVKCSEYDVPQKRTRMVLFASVYGEVKMCAPFSEKPKTVLDVIGKLPRIGAGKVCPEDSLHRARNLSELNLKRIRASVRGGTWHDWDESLITDCHKKKQGKTYASVYGRMDWKLAPTITTEFYGYGSGRFGHPKQHRAISLREGALLQTFPESYSFTPPDENISFEKIGRMIGNAVPVNLGRAIARSLNEHLDKYNVSKTPLPYDSQPKCS